MTLFNSLHENFAIIKNLSIRDGQVVRVGELRVSGINGLIGYDEDYGIPPGRFMRIVNKIKGVDILVTHQPPYIPELYPNMRDSEPAMLMTQALERIRPRTSKVDLYLASAGGTSANATIIIIYDEYPVLP